MKDLAYSIAAVASGVSIHLAVYIRGEWDALVLHLLAGYLALHQAFVLVAASIQGCSYMKATKEVVYLEAFHCLGLACSIVAYRLFFHPLRHFPGPWSFKISVLARAIKIYLSGERGAVMLHDLHAQHTDIVRIGPNHLSIKSARSLPIINGTGKSTVCHKSVAYIFPTYPASVNAERDPARHEQHRKIWDKALDPVSVSYFIPRILDLLSVHVDRLRRYRGEQVELTSEYSLLVCDILGSVGYGHSGGLGAMVDGKQPRLMDDITLTWRFGIYMMILPWLHVILDWAPDLWGLIYKSDIKIREFIDLAIRRRAAVDVSSSMKSSTPRDIMSHLMAAELHGRPLSQEQLVSDGFIMSVALTDTTVTTLFHLTYRIARHPELKEVLLNELQVHVPAKRVTEDDWPTISRLPYLDAFINETLRIHPPNPSPFSRVTPPEGITLEGGTFIPGDVIVTMPEWSLHRDPRCFVDPEAFIPERWISHDSPRSSNYTPRPELVLDRRAFIPFLHGPYRCPGKYLAYLELKLWLTSMLIDFDVVFPPNADLSTIDESMANDWKDYGMTHPGKMYVCFQERAMVS